MNATDPFAAIADPNRRILLEELRRGPKTVNQLAALLPGISRPAVSQHLKALLDAQAGRSAGAGNQPRLFTVAKRVHTGQPVG